MPSFRDRRTHGRQWRSFFQLFSLENGIMASGMWCPKCAEKFPVYYRVCPECQVDLTAQRPGPAPSPELELACVFVADNEVLTGIAKALLEGEKIEYLDRFRCLQDLFGWGRFGAGYNFVVGPVEFWVRADEAEKARACLEGLGTPIPEDTARPDDGPEQSPPVKSD